MVIVQNAMYSLNRSQVHYSDIPNNKLYIFNFWQICDNTCINVEIEINWIYLIKKYTYIKKAVWMNLPLFFFTFIPSNSNLLYFSVFQVCCDSFSFSHARLICICKLSLNVCESVNCYLSHLSGCTPPLAQWLSCDLKIKK